MKLRTLLRAGLLAGAVTLTACEAVAPALTSLAVAVGQDLLSSAAMNHSDRYAQQLDHLFVTMAREMTKMPLLSANERGEVLQNRQDGGYGQGGYDQGGYDQGGYGAGDPNQGGYDQGGYDQGGYDQGGYDQGGYDQGEYAQGAYDPGGYGQDTGYEQQGAYDQPGYDQQAYETTTDPYGNGSTDPYGNAAPDPYANTGTVPYGSTTTDPYATAQDVNLGSAPIEVSVALLKAAQSATGRTTLVPVQDGERLSDGNGDSAQADRLRFEFRANCACYVYLVGVDSTGYVASIFPDPDLSFGNPVRADQLYQIPGLNEWWMLDQQDGVEHIYVVASRNPRPDIEAALRELAGIPAGAGLTSPAGTATAASPGFTPVAQPYIQRTRGLVKVSETELAGTQSAPQAGYGAVPARLDTFRTPTNAEDLMLTRWFYHD